jgi:hypothetical protein
MYASSTLFYASKRVLKDDPRILVDRLTYSACNTSIINNEKHSCSCDKSFEMLSNLVSSMFSSATLCALFEYEICFHYALQFISQTSLFSGCGTKGEHHLTAFEPIVCIKLTPMLFKINIFIAKPDFFSTLICILLRLEKTTTFTSIYQRIRV